VGEVRLEGLALLLQADEGIFAIYRLVQHLLLLPYIHVVYVV
jgi:hypothetical protein